MKTLKFWTGVRTTALSALMCALCMGTFTACGDDEPDSDKDKTETPTNKPSGSTMAGKTLRHEATITTNDGDSKIYNKIIINFTTDSDYHIYFQQIGSYFDIVTSQYVENHWNTIDKDGTYTYTANKIQLYDEDGSKYYSLTKNGSGWVFSYWDLVLR